MSGKVNQLAQTSRLVFPWPRQHDLHLLLPVMIGLALVLHIGALLLFQLIYPRATTGEPASARVLVPGPQTPGWENTRVWVEAADPSIFAATRPEEPLGSLQSPRPFIPSYMQSSLQLRLPEDSALELPSLRLGQMHPIVESWKPPRISSEPSTQPPANIARFVVNGEPSRSISLPPDFPEQPNGLPTSPAIYLVRYGEDGAVRSLFLQSASGSSSWDSWSGDALYREKFNMPANSAGWAWISVHLEKSPAPPLPDSEPPQLLP